MYRVTTSRRKRGRVDGQVWALAHNHRVQGRTQAQVLLNLGREDRLDQDGLRRLIGSINRYLGDQDGGGDALSATGTGGDVVAAAGLRMVESRPMGTVWLLDGLWKALGVDAALRSVLGARRFSTDVEQVLFALVANRAVDPSSKVAAAEWASRDAVIPGL